MQGGIDPEDIVQETLLAIHMKRHTWRDDAPVTPWLYAIARYKLIDAFRRRGRLVEIEIGEIAERFPQPEPETVSDREIGRPLERSEAHRVGKECGRKDGSGVSRDHRKKKKQK